MNTAGGVKSRKENGRATNGLSVSVTEHKINGRTGLAAVEPSDALAPVMGITDAEIARRKEWLEFGEQDVKRVTSANAFARRIQDEVIERLHELDRSAA